MNAKEYLQQYKEAEIDLRILNDKAEMLKQSVKYPRSIRYDKEPSGPSEKNSTEITILNYLEMEKQIDEKRLELIKLRDEICDTIRQLDNRHYEILYLKHIKQLKYWEIARAMNYDESYARSKLYPNALEELEKYLKGSKR